MQDQIEHYNRFAKLAGNPGIKQYTNEEFQEKFLGISPLSAFEWALKENNVSYIKNKLGTITMSREDMDIDVYGGMIRGYDETADGNISVPLHLIR